MGEPDKRRGTPATFAILSPIMRTASRILGIDTLTGAALARGIFS
jgi:hypothetical protein